MGLSQIYGLMLPPLTYYGGKANSIKHLLLLVPKGYKIYTEAFCGGASMFFALNTEGVEVEVLNDLNLQLMNF